jgi:hypothetical protein
MRERMASLSYVIDMPAKVVRLVFTPAFSRRTTMIRRP